MPEETYEISVTVPQEMELTDDEKLELKQKFTADVVETLEARGEAVNTVELEIVDIP